MAIVINGETIDKDEAQKLLRMIYKDAEKVAGEFHNMNRSAKFRANWPNEYLYAEANWKSFVGAVRQMYAQRLGDPKTPPAEARMMHLALVLEREIAKGGEADTRLQLTPGTQQFEGDKRENVSIIEKFGKRSNTFKDLLLSSANKNTYH
jgi:hypothetical protein